MAMDLQGGIVLDRADVPSVKRSFQIPLLKGTDMSDGTTDLLLVVMARPRAMSGKSHGHISLAVYQRGLYLKGWGYYPEGVKCEKDSDIHLYDTAAARGIGNNEYIGLRQYIASDQDRRSRYVPIFNDCTDWVIRALRHLGIPTPTDRLLPVSLAEAFQKCPGWTPFRVSYPVPVLHGSPISHA